MNTPTRMEMPATSERPKPVSETPAPLRLGSYELIYELAAGGMATVYIARQIGAAGFERLVVIKRVHRHLVQDDEFRDMFIDEARVASQIRHPNVVSVTDVVEAEGEIFLVMDYVESVSLAKLLRRATLHGERLPPPVAARIIADTLSGLHAAHEACDMRGQRLDVVHRDVSPQNVLVGVDGISRLIDFGIAKATDRISSTRSGHIKGKLAYMSPEGVRGHSLDRRADLFAAGTMMYEALSGKRLFVGENQLDVARQVTTFRSPVEPLVPDVPPQFDAILRRALEPDREARFPTASMFLDAIAEAVPMASTADVQATLQRHCGKHLGDRTVALRAQLAEMRTPVTHRRTLVEPVADAPSTGTQIAAMRDLLVPGKQRSGIRNLVAFGGALLAAGLAAFHWGPPWPGQAVPPTDVGPPPAAARTVSSGTDVAAPPQPARSSSPDARANEVEIVLESDQPIKGVVAEGLRSVALEGTRAHAFVARWPGRLRISAVLENGQVNVAYAEAGEQRSGPLVIRLTTATSAAPVPRKSQPRRAPADPIELHDNPY